jgi:hypothetical protein
MRPEQSCNLGLDGLHQQRSRTVAQNLSQRISKTSWLAELETLVSVTAYHSFGGEVEARTPSRYAALPLHAVTNFRPYSLSDINKIYRFRFTERMDSTKSLIAASWRSAFRRKPLTRCTPSSLRATLHRRLFVAAIGFVGRHPLRLTFIAHQAH